jgi:hypothetical protein
LKTLITTVIALALLAASFGGANAADTKVNGRLYASWGMDMTDGADNANEFGLDRAYITVKSKLSDFTSVRLTTDLRESEVDGKTRYDLIVKYAYGDWMPKFGEGKFTVRFGLQPTQYIDFQNALWGRRYLLKTVSDDNKYLTSADLGASVIFGLGEKGKSGNVVLSIFNGTSYSDLGEMNSRKDIALFAKLYPLKDNEQFKESAITGQFYSGTHNEEIVDGVDASDFKKQIISLGGLLAYDNTVNFGADFNFVSHGDSAISMDPGKYAENMSGISFFGTLFFDGLTSDESSALRTLNLFGRYDIVDPDTDMDDDGHSMFVGGIECAPAKGIKASLNLRSISYEADGMDSESYLFVNTLFKF